MSQESVAVSKALQQLAAEIDAKLTAIAGKPVSFSLFVWTDGRVNYVANSTDRDFIKGAVHAIIDGWDSGMPDVPAHEVQ